MLDKQLIINRTIERNRRKQLDSLIGFTLFMVIAVLVLVAGYIPLYSVFSVNAVLARYMVLLPIIRAEHAAVLGFLLLLALWMLDVVSRANHKRIQELDALLEVSPDGKA